MKNVLVIAGHPNLQISTANTTILSKLENEVAGSTVRRLCELAPNYTFDIAAEQEALKKADLVVLQFPLNWYHTPALLKKWIDEVLLYGFAYGEGAVLGGKTLVVSYTAAAPDACYAGAEALFVDKEHILNLFRATAKMCAMNFGGAVVTNGFTPNITGDAALAAEQVAKATTHADELIALLKSL